MNAKNKDLVVGIIGPVTICSFLQYLDLSDKELKKLPTGMGGTPIVNLCLELLKIGHRIIIFTLDLTVTQEIILTGKKLTICIGPYRQRARYRALDFFKKERKYLTSAIKRESPDILHAHWTYEFAWAAIKSGLPTLVTIHDIPSTILRYDFSAYRVVRAIMASIVIKRTKHFSCVSPYVANSLWGPWKTSNYIEVIPNPLPSSVTSMTAKHNKDDGVTFATVLNGWKGYKNGLIVLEAFHSVRTIITNAKLVMFGRDFEQGGYVHLWAKNRGLDKDVEFCGPRPYDVILSELATRISVLVHPSLEESFSMVVAEAMALEVPVIGGKNSGAVPWTMEFGVGGLITDVRSKTQIADEMVKLGKDYELRKAIGTKGRESSLKRFSPEVIARQYKCAYNKIIGGKYQDGPN